MTILLCKGSARLNLDYGRVSRRKRPTLCSRCPEGTWDEHLERVPLHANGAPRDALGVGSLLAREVNQKERLHQVVAVTFHPLRGYLALVAYLMPNGRRYLVELDRAYPYTFRGNIRMPALPSRWHGLVDQCERCEGSGLRPGSLDRWAGSRCLDCDGTGVEPYGGTHGRRGWVDRMT